MIGYVYVSGARGGTLNWVSNLFISRAICACKVVKRPRTKKVQDENEVKSKWAAKASVVLS